MLKSKTSKRYSDAEKLELIRAYKSSGMLMDQFTRIYGLGHSTLSRWMYNFAHSNVILDNSSMKKSSNSSKSYKELELEEKVRNLEKALEHEKLRSLAYSTMIDVAEEYFGIEIRKKTGAKQ